jgi:tetratricopeptide (TPR) repeat protein
MASASAPIKHPNGISLAGFRALMDAHGGRAELEGKSTAWVKLNVVIPATAPAKTPYTALMDGAHVAPATAFVSHAYNDEFLGMVDAITTLEAREGTSAFYYFDLLVVNQHGQDATVPFEVLRDEFGQSVRAIGRTLLYLRWADPIPLGRAWCVFEMGTTLEVGAGLKVIMPPADVASFKHALEDDFDSLTYKTCRVDVEKATAREANDLVNIQRAIVEGGGFLKTNQLVIGAMKGWMVEEARSALEEMPVKERATSALINNLANLLKGQGKLSDAEPLYREALAGRRRTLGDEHPSTLSSINNLAILLKGQGRLGEAEPLYREAFFGRRRTLEVEHPDTLGSINNLGLLLYEQGKLGDAEPLFREALAGRRRTLEVEHPDTLGSINNLGLLLYKQGKLGDAEPLFREALAGRRRTLGDEHPSTLNSINNLANLLKGQGKQDDAEPLYREALAGRRRTLGDEHPDTLSSFFNFAGLLWKQGKKNEALEMYRQELEGVRRVFGEDHPSTQQSLRNYNNLRQPAGLLLKQGKKADASWRENADALWLE